MRFDFRKHLQSIRCPVLIMAGLLDPMVTIDDARELATALPPETTQILEFENAGHMLALEEPEKVIDAITKFIVAGP